MGRSQRRWVGGGMSSLVEEMAGAPLKQAPESSKSLCQDA